MPRKKKTVTAPVEEKKPETVEVKEEPIKEEKPAEEVKPEEEVKTEPVVEKTKAEPKANKPVAKKKTGTKSTSKKKKAEPKTEEVKAEEPKAEEPAKVEEAPKEESVNSAPVVELNEPVPDCVAKEASEGVKEPVVAEEVPTVEEKKGFGKKGFFAVGALCGLGLGLIFGSVGGTSSTPKVKDDYETVSLYGSASEAINADTKAKFEEAGLVPNLMSDDFLSHVGTAMPEIELTTLDGETLNLADYKGKRVILEVVSANCVYSQKMSAEYLDDIIEHYPDTVFIQCFLSEDVSAIKDFYKAVGKKPREDMPVIIGNNELTAWISSVDFIGFPSFYMFDEDGKLAGTIIGYMEGGVFDGYYKLAFNDVCKTYELTTDAGETLPEFSAKIKKARQYMSELTEIDVPKSYLNSVDFE